MQAFFSGTDDRYELGDPGLHIVVGTINTKKRTYTLLSSITACNRRFIVDHNAVIDPTPTPDAKYHPAVLDVVQHRTSLFAPAQQGFKTWTNPGFNPNAGNGYRQPTSPDNFDWDEFGVAPWDPSQWDARKSNTQLDTGDICALLEELVQNAIAAGNEEILPDALSDLEQQIQQIRADLYTSNSELMFSYD